MNQNLPKPFRAGLGLRIENLFVEILEVIYQTIYAGGSEKDTLLVLAIRKSDLLKFLLQIAWEHKHLPDKKYIPISNILEESGKMLFRWRGSIVIKIGNQKLPSL